MLVDFIIAELMIWAVMIALLPVAVATIDALTRRTPLLPPRPARRRRRRTASMRADLRDRAVSVVASQRRPSASPIKVTLRP